MKGAYRELEKRACVNKRQWMKRGGGGGRGEMEKEKLKTVGKRRGKANKTKVKKSNIR